MINAVIMIDKHAAKLDWYDHIDQQMSLQLERYISSTLNRGLNSSRWAKAGPLGLNDVELLLSIHRFDLEFDRLAKQFLKTRECNGLLVQQAIHHAL